MDVSQGLLLISRFSSSKGENIMQYQDQCPGYFERDDQEIIEKNGPNFAPFFCALCGQKVRPTHKDGGWIPANHSATVLINQS
jgi:hypothetical protein